jgi:hypothetical protein
MVVVSDILTEGQSTIIIELVSSLILLFLLEAMPTQH